jgi:hypothetical protein
MSVEYKKGYLVKHPKIDDWGVGVVLEDSNGKTVEVSFKNAGKKSLSLQYVEPEILSKEPLLDVEIRQFLQKDRIYRISIILRTCTKRSPEAVWACSLYIYTPLATELPCSSRPSHCT